MVKKKDIWLLSISLSDGSSLTFSDNINVLLYVNAEPDSCITHKKEQHVVVLFTKAFALVGGAVNEHLGTDNIPKR